MRAHAWAPGCPLLTAPFIRAVMLIHSSNQLLTRRKVEQRTTDRRNPQLGQQEREVIVKIVNDPCRQLNQPPVPTALGCQSWDWQWQQRPPRHLHPQNPVASKDPSLLPRRNHLFLSPIFPPPASQLPARDVTHPPLHRQKQSTFRRRASLCTRRLPPAPTR